MLEELIDCGEPKVPYRDFGKNPSPKKKQAACHAMSLGAIMGGLERPELNMRWTINRNIFSEVPYPFSIDKLLAAISRLPTDLHLGVLKDIRHSEQCSPCPSF